MRVFIIVVVFALLCHLALATTLNVAPIPREICSSTPCRSGGWSKSDTICDILYIDPYCPGCNCGGSAEFCSRERGPDFQKIDSLYCDAISKGYKCADYNVLDPEAPFTSYVWMVCCAETKPAGGVERVRNCDDLGNTMVIPAEICANPPCGVGEMSKTVCPKPDYVYDAFCYNNCGDNVNYSVIDKFFCDKVKSGYNCTEYITQDSRPSYLGILTCCNKGGKPPATQQTSGRQISCPTPPLPPDGYGGIIALAAATISLVAFVGYVITKK